MRLYRNSPKFQSTLRARRSDQKPCGTNKSSGQDFNPRSARGGATALILGSYPRNMISIHAPREAERLEAFEEQEEQLKFQSTLRARRSDFSTLTL